MQIHKVAVLGSGVMGSGIAAHFANAGIPVVLLDIVPPAKPGEAPAANRNLFTETARDKQLKASPSGFTHLSKAQLVTCGNLEDHLDLLKDVDWIVEAVLEKLEVKQAVYQKIDAVRKAGSVVSSNTSTLPLHTLTHGLSDAFQRDFMITHFFNPPRFMRLLEVLAGPNTRRDAYDAICHFADVTLGKSVVECKDTPGFIANRIGVFWMMVGLFEAIRLGIRVEEADAVMGRPLGIPKTGIFGLFDLIGIDLMPLIAKAMLDSLPANDPFRVLYHEPQLISKMIAEGYTGRKGKGGFTRIEKTADGKKIKQVLDLKTGEYRAEQKAALASVEAAKAGVGALLTHSDIGGQYARAVMGQTLAYAASLIPEISDDIAAVDEAMRTGYNWKFGPFEMIDRLGHKDAAGKEICGADVLADMLRAAAQPVPALLTQAAGKKLYTVAEGRVQVFALGGKYHAKPAQEGVWSLADIKRSGAKPLAKNASASLWDVGDGALCLELTSKMNAVDPDILTLMGEALKHVPQHFRGLMIGGDTDNFSVGANLGLMLFAANIAAWSQISDMIRQGQQTLMALKYAPFPVVAATHGMALGGGCEISLHCDAVQAHVEFYPGLVEVGVGLIPGWGGCKEMLLRHATLDASGGNKGGQQSDPALSAPHVSDSMSRSGGNHILTLPMQSVSKAFETIMLAKVATSAEEAKDMKVLNEKSGITMNRARLLADAKHRLLQLADGYAPPAPLGVKLPGPAAKVALEMAMEGFVSSGKATPHDQFIARHLAEVLSGGATDVTKPLTEQQLLDLEHAMFMELVKTKPTLARIEHMLENGKPLRN